MGYKWIGAVLIMASCSGCGFAIAAGKRREEQLLYQLMEILQFLRWRLFQRYHSLYFPWLSDLVRDISL